MGTFGRIGSPEFLPGRPGGPIGPCGPIPGPGAPGWLTAGTHWYDPDGSGPNHRNNWPETESHQPSPTSLTTGGVSPTEMVLAIVSQQKRVEFAHQRDRPAVIGKGV